MGQEAPNTQPSPPPFNGEQLVKAATYFFQWYCRDQNIAPDDIPKLNPGHFLKWLRERYAFGASSAEITDSTVSPFTGYLAEKMDDVPAAAFEFVMQLGESSTGMAHLSGMWPYLVLANRPTENEIRSVQMLLVLQWSDGTVCPLNRISHKDSNPVPIKDPEVVHFLTSQGSQMAHHVMAVGCDALHDGHQAFKDIGNPDTLAKVMLAAEDALKHGKLTPDDMAKIGQLVTYVGTLFPKVLPERAMAEFKAQQQGKTLPSRPAQAGWNN